MKDGGYFKLYRRAFRDVDHGGDPLWNEHRVWSRAEAWLYLLAITAHGPHDKPLKGGRVVRLERGQFFASLRYLARKWGWSKDKVARFLAQLDSQMGRIVRANRDTEGDTYLIVNWDAYQSTRDSQKDSGETVARQSRDKREEGKKKAEEGIEDQDQKGVAARLEDKPAQQQALLTFPCIGKPGEPREWGLTAEYVAELAEAYEGLDVLSEARRSLAWIKANRRKTARGMKRFITGWLDKAAQRPPGPTLFPTNGPAPRIPARRADASEPSRATVTKPRGW